MAKNTTALVNVLGMSADVGDPRQGAIDFFTQVGGIMDDIGVDDCDIMKALGAHSKTLSSRGAYYKIQGVILEYTGTIGGVLITILGIAALIYIIEKAVATLLDWCAKIVGLLVSVLEARNPAVAILEAIFGRSFGSSGPTAHYSAGDSTMLRGILSVAMPGPLSMLASGLINDFAGTVSIGGGTVTMAPTNQQPSIPPAAPAIAGSTVHTTQPSTTSSSTLGTAVSLLTNPTIDSVASNLYNDIFGTDTGGALDVGGDNNILADAEVYDDEDKVKRILKAAIILGVHPQDLHRVMMGRRDAVRDAVRDQNPLTKLASSQF